MDFEEKIDEIRLQILNTLSKLTDIEKEMRDTATMNAIRSDIIRATLQHKDAITIKEASERSGISVQSLYRYRDQGMLKVKEGEKMKAIIMVEDWVNFLTSLPG